MQITILALLSTGMAVVGATSTANLLSKVLRTMSGTNCSGHVMRARMLDVSDQCETDTDALHNSEEAANAYASWEAELFQQDMMSLCDIAMEASTVKCVFDSKSMSTHKDLVSACEQADGKVHFYSDSITCKVSQSGMNLELSIDFVDIPECVALTCGTQEVAEELTNVAGEIAGEYEDMLSSEFDSAQCTSESLAFNEDVSPNDRTETKDADSDGMGDNGDVFPNGPPETKNNDSGGVGDNGPNTNVFLGMMPAIAAFAWFSF